jgi:HSP20 family protein
MKRRQDFVWDSGWTMTLFGRLVHGVSGRLPSVPESAGETSGPAMDIYENSRDVVIEIEVPGLTRDNLQVRIDGGRLSVEGYKESERNAESVNFLCLERQVGVFRRIVQLPESVDTSAVQASLIDGILKVTLPRVSERRGTAVDVPIDQVSFPSGEERP